MGRCAGHAVKLANIIPPWQYFHKEAIILRGAVVRCPWRRAPVNEGHEGLSVMSSASTRKRIHWPLELFLAFRYLRPKRTFVSFITLLSVLGPALGVAVLVIVNAVMLGFQRNIKESIMSWQAHLHVYQIGRAHV